MRNWKLTGPIANPPNADGLPTTIPYIRQFALDMAYVAPPSPQETRTAFKHRLYEVLLTMMHNATETGEMRIIRKYPEIPWQRA
jgi:hypothetical protein